MRYNEVDFLTNWNWKLFTTLTFRGKQNHQNAEKMMMEWVREIYRQDRVRVAVIGVIHSTNTQTHIHLLMIPANYTEREIVENLGCVWENRWSHGISSIELIRDRDKAARYVQSHMSANKPDTWSFVFYNKRLLHKLRSIPAMRSAYMAG